MTSAFPRPVLAVLAVLGLVVPNGLFFYGAIAHPEFMHAALRNPVALGFMLESLLLLVLGCAWVQASGRRPGWVVFLLLSLGGSLAFSVPAWLWWQKGREVKASVA